jgi:hypothetical protein
LAEEAAAVVMIELNAARVGRFAGRHPWNR